MAKQALEAITELCKTELVGRRIIKVNWRYSWRLNIEVESSTRHGVYLCYDQENWKLVSIVNDRLVASRQGNGDEYTPIMKALEGCIITSVEIRVDLDYAIWLTFDNGMQLQTEACYLREDDDASPCWQLFCSSGYVLKVGAPSLNWSWKRRDVPMSEKPQQSGRLDR
jgi:hypothetical protein